MKPKKWKIHIPKKKLRVRVNFHKMALESKILHYFISFLRAQTYYFAISNGLGGILINCLPHLFLYPSVCVYDVPMYFILSWYSCVVCQKQTNDVKMRKMRHICKSPELKIYESLKEKFCSLLILLMKKIVK